jgi:hypothetical protein
VAAELDADGRTDGEVDERQRIEADAPGAHRARYAQQRRRDAARDDGARAPAAEHQRRDAKDGERGAAQHLQRKQRQVQVLVEEDVEDATGKASADWARRRGKLASPVREHFHAAVGVARVDVGSDTLGSA